MCKPAAIISEILLAIGSLLALFTLVAGEPEAPFRIARVRDAEDFQHGLRRWTSELEKPGRVKAKEGTLEMDVPAGYTVWFRPELSGPVMMKYEAVASGRDGHNARAIDLNCFWLASDARSPESLFATKRSGKFADYNQLRRYYVEQGGNGNTFASWD